MLDQDNKVKIFTFDDYRVIVLIENNLNFVTLISETQEMYEKNINKDIFNQMCNYQYIRINSSVIDEIDYAYKKLLKKNLKLLNTQYVFIGWDQYIDIGDSVGPKRFIFYYKLFENEEDISEDEFYDSIDFAFNNIDDFDLVFNYIKENTK